MRSFERSFKVEEYDLAATLSSGQAFRWKPRGESWEGVIHGRWIALTQRIDGIDARVAKAVEEWDWLIQYLQLDCDISTVIQTFPKDPHLGEAVSTCKGLRLLRQEPWECLASFILSSTKQIVQIQQIVELLCARYGEPIASAAGSAAFAFPTAAGLAALSEQELRDCKMGFRAPYLARTARMVQNEVNLDAISKLELERAREELMKFPGVGRKIADCVLLFAYGFQQAFPVDVWVLKALRQLYFPRRKPTPGRLLRFTQNYFGPNAGYAQQYLFHYMRTKRS
ncbi:MAG: DNA glycosylase [Verrucomicrobiota bacterium]|nr:DNA glycosylase [Verrucomicrobiota bacterium]